MTRINVSFDIDTEKYAEMLGSGVDKTTLESWVYERLNKDLAEQILYDGLGEWDPYKEVIRDIEDYLY